jgi:peptide/nickel transport system substrate-binding protein
LVFLALALTAGACPDGTEPAAPEPNPPAADGTLRLGYPEEPPTLNPATEAAPAALDLLRAVLPSFFLVTPDLRYQPYLLDDEPSVRRHGERMTVRFSIDEDAVWSDGTPVTVEDVAFTWKVMSRPGSPRPDGFEHLADVVEVTPKEGRLVLEPPMAGWRDLFSAGRFVLPAHAARSVRAVERWDRGPPVTAGPFSLERWIPGRSVTLAADPSFWGPPSRLARMEVAFVPDPTTALQLLRSGRLDALAPMLGISWGHRLRRLDGVTVTSASGADLVHLILNVRTVGPAQVRRRLIGAIDRTRFAGSVLRQEAAAAEGVVAPEQGEALPAWRGYGLDPPAPLDLSAELSLVYVRGELLGLVARYVQAELRRAGADVELVPLEADVFRGTFLPEGRFDLAITETRTGPSPELWRWAQAEGAAPPLSGLRDGRLMTLQIRAERGGEDETEALEAAQERLASLAPVLPLFQPEVTMAWRNGVTGIRPNPSVDGPLWNAWAWSGTA